jgi:integrase
MPAPWLIARTSGLYCRVFVPADLRAHLGQRFLVRSLGSRDRDQARLLAARYALVIGELFRQLRRELSMAEPKVEDIIKTIQSGGTRDLILKGLKAPNGTTVDEVVINDANDAKLFKEEFGSVFNPAPPPPPVPSWVQSSGGKFRRLAAHGVVISQRVPPYLEYIEKRHPKYVQKAPRVIKMLIDICGDLPPDDYEPEDIDHFLKRIKFLPRNPEKNKEHRDRWAKMNFDQISVDVETRVIRPRITNETIKDHVAQLAAFFSFCKARRYMDEERPLAKQLGIDSSTQSEERRDPFSVDDLRRIFDPQLYAGRNLPHTFWPPLIALYTGARCNEIAQLYLDDIVNDDIEHPERWRFMIRIGPGRTDQRLKNKFSNRSIPMHPRLIELGFLHYLDDVRSLGFERVFPSLRWTAAAGYGDTVSDMFSTYLRKKVMIDAPRKVFHSFRHYFCTQAKNFTDQERPRVLDLTGHAREGEFDLTYARELFYENKMKVLMKISMPKLEVPKYEPGRFLAYLHKTKKKKNSEAAASPEVKAAQKQARTRKAISQPTVNGFSIKATRPRKAKSSESLAATNQTKKAE